MECLLAGLVQASMGANASVSANAAPSVDQLPEEFRHAAHVAWQHTTDDSSGPIDLRSYAELTTDFAPCDNANCVGFSAVQRGKLAIECYEVGRDQIPVEDFAALFERVRGYNPSQRFLKTIAMDGHVSLSKFQALCGVDPSSRSAVPFGLFHARRCLARHSSFLGLTFYVPFLVLLTLFSVSGRHLTTNRDSVAVLDDVLRSGARVRAGTLADCVFLTCPVDDAEPSVFEEINNDEKWYRWLSQAVTTLWSAANRNTGPLGRALGSVDGSIPVGAFRIRSVRFAAFNDTAQSEYYGTGPTLRYRRDTVSRASLSLDVSAAVASAVLMINATVPVSDTAVTRVSSWLLRSLTYQSCGAANGSVSYTGSAASYGCGGHIVDIPFNSSLQEAWLTAQAMQSMKWASSDVGALFVELFTFQLNELSFVSYAVLQEVLPGGHWRDFHYFTAADVFSFSHGSTFNLTVDILFAAAVLIFLIRFSYDTHTAVTWRKRLIGGAGLRAHLIATANVFGTDPWLWVDTVNLACMLATSVVRWTSIGLQASVSDYFQVNYFPDKLDLIANLQTVVGYLDAAVVIISYFRLLKYTRFHPAFLAAANTLKRAAGDLIGTAVTFAVLFMGFTLAATNVYSTELEQFESVDISGSTLLRAIVADLDYAAMAEAHAIFTPLFFAAYMLAMSLITLNIVIALLTRAYETACEDVLRRAKTPKIGASDSSSILARSQRNLWKRFVALPLISDLRLRLFLLRNCCKPTPQGFEHGNPRRTYSTLEDLLVDIHFGSNEECALAISQLITSCAERCPDAAFDPMPTFADRASREPGRSLRAKLEKLLGRDCRAFLLIFVWLPAVACDLDAAELLDDLCLSRQEWLADIERISHLEATTAVASSTSRNPPYEEVARKYRAIALSTSRQSSLLKPYEVRNEIAELTGNVDDELDSVDWYALWCNFGAPHEAPQLNEDLILSAAVQDRDDQLSRARQLGWSSAHRTAFCHMSRFANISTVADLADAARRATGRSLQLSSKRLLENDPISDAAIALSAGERFGSDTSTSSFLLHFFSENRKRTSDRLQLVLFLWFYAVFAYSVLSHRFLGEGLEAPKHSNTFVNKPFFSGSSPSRRTFAHIQNARHYFDWLRQVVTPQLSSWLDLTGTMVVGAVKLRQQRGAETDCADERFFTAPTPFTFLFNATLNKSRCALPIYGNGASTAPLLRNSSQVSPIINRSLYYSDSRSLHGFGGISTRLAGLVSSGGYGLLLPSNASHAWHLAVLNELESVRWIDDRSRIIVLEVLTFSASSNAFTALAFVTSISTGGEWVNEVTAYPFSITDWTTMRPAEIIFMVFYGVMVLYALQRFFTELTAAYTLATLKQPMKSGLWVFAAEFVSTLWWPLDALTLLIFICTWTLRFYAAAVARGDIEATQTASYFTATEELAKTALIVTQLDSVNLVLCSAKFLSFLRTDNSLSVFAATIAKSARNIFALAVTATVLLVGFGLTAFCWFGDTGRGFLTLQDSLGSLLLVTTLGRSGFEDELEEQSPVSYTVFFVIFILSMKVVLLNLFIAVLTRGFSEVSEDIFDDEELDALLESDPSVSFGSETWMQFLTSIVVFREALYWMRLIAFTIVGPADDDGASGLSELDRIRFHNPRILWSHMEALMLKLELGSSTDRSLASAQLLALLRDVVFMLNNPVANEEHIPVAYSTSSIPVADDREARRGFRPRPNPTVSVHGFQRRTVEDYVKKKLGDTFNELDLIGIGLPQVCLRQPKRPCLKALLSSHHAWARAHHKQSMQSRVGLTQSRDGVRFNEDLQYITRKVTELCA